MTWVRTDDNAPLHPKQIKAGPVACWLWIAGIAHCNRHATDGMIEKVALGALYPSDLWSRADQKRAAAKLVELGIWHDEGKFWRVHDYEIYQEEALKVNVEERRVDARERKRRERERKRIAKIEGMSQRDLRVTSDVTSRVTSAVTYRGTDPHSGAGHLPLSQAPVPALPDPVPSNPIPEGEREPPLPLIRALPFETRPWTAEAQAVAFRAAWMARYDVEPGMGGKEVGTFHRAVLSTAKARQTAPRELFDAALSTWLAQPRTPTEKRAPYACFQSAWCELHMADVETAVAGPQTAQQRHDRAQAQCARAIAENWQGERATAVAREATEAKAALDAEKERGRFVRR